MSNHLKELPKELLDLVCGYLHLNEIINVYQVLRRDINYEELTRKVYPGVYKIARVMKKYTEVDYKEIYEQIDMAKLYLMNDQPEYLDKLHSSDIPSVLDCRHIKYHESIFPIFKDYEKYLSIDAKVDKYIHLIPKINNSTDLLVKVLLEYEDTLNMLHFYGTALLEGIHIGRISFDMNEAMLFLFLLCLEDYNKFKPYQEMVLAPCSMCSYRFDMDKFEAIIIQRYIKDHLQRNNLL